jgi:hypothetical protein
MERLYPVSVEAPPRPVGPPFSLAMNSNLRAITNIDPTKYRLVRLRSGQYQLMTVPRSSMVVLCGATGNSAQVVSVLSDADDASNQVREDACATRRSYDDDETGSAPPAKMITIGVAPGTYAIQLRSTLEVIRYVGQILAFQETETAKYPQLPERCITLQFIVYDSLHATCDGAVLIHLVDTTATIAPPDLSVIYHGRRWSVAAPHSCVNLAHCDLSQSTMSIISLLLNRNKSAAEIAKTPAVEVVP